MNPDSAKNEIATGRAGRGEARVSEQAQVEHRSVAGALPGHERRREQRGEREAGERSRAAPAVIRRLDDRVDEQPDHRRREREPDPVGPRRGRIARCRHGPCHEGGRDRGDRRHREEDARPVERLEQPAADDRSERDRRAGGRAPESDRPRALAALGEDVGDQRQRGRKDHRGSDAHHAPRDDQLPGTVGQPAGDARQAEHAEAREQHPLAPEAVAEAPRGEYRSGEQQVVGVDDPLQLRVRGVQLAHERRQRDVDDRGVQVDRERSQQERDENERLTAHGFLLGRAQKQVGQFCKPIT